MKEAPDCNACGLPIRAHQGIMTTLKGPYHSDQEGCRQTARLQAPKVG